jgi:hypothetical protein
MMTKTKNQSESTRLRRGGAYEALMAMTPDRRDALVAGFEKENLHPGAPLTQADKALHRRAARAAKAKMGRPKVGAGAKIVPISIERGLLKRADAFAKRHRLKRSQMIAQGLQLLMNQ